MYGKFSKELKSLLTLSRNEAIRLSHDYVGTEHFLLSILIDENSTTAKILKTQVIDLTEIKLKIKAFIPSTPNHISRQKLGDIPLNRQAEEILKDAYLIAKKNKSLTISPEDLILSALKHKSNGAAKILNVFEIDFEFFKAAIERIKGLDEKSSMNSNNKNPKGKKSSWWKFW